MHKQQIDRVRAREERRRAAFAAQRERERARGRREARRIEDEARAQEARSALSGWANVNIARHGSFWIAAGRAPMGAPFATTDADPAKAAQRLLEAADASRQSVIGNRRSGEPVHDDHASVEVEEDTDLGSEAVECTPTADCPLPTAGVMIEYDEVARLRLALSMEVDREAARRIAARNPHDAADVARARDLNNLLMLGLISETQRGELDVLNARVGWARRVEDVARAAKRSIAEAPPEALTCMDAAGVQWPE